MRLLATLLRWLIFMALAGFIAAFAISNPQLVTLNLFPFPYEQEVPLYGIALAMTALGIVLGGVSVAVGGIKFRAECARLRRRLQATENELNGMKLTKAAPPSGA